MPIKYVPFIPEPIEGQAVLQNFHRVIEIQRCRRNLNDFGAWYAFV